MNTGAAFQPNPASVPCFQNTAGKGAPYFFYKPGQLRVPLDFSNNAVLNLLKNSGIRFWDQERRNRQKLPVRKFIG